ncbi:hypothetical protein ACQYAD_09110 [Neobacillus sp. SM06]|uniref:hypothetical protein n=1 Tax=Neobacillus sp. SM06 TaxID=3422492 RepID=UPI003D2AF460
MNKWMWYAGVVAAMVLFILSLLTGKILISIISLIFALFLKRFYHKIPLPRVYTKNKIYSNISGKIYPSSTPKKHKAREKR